MSEQESCKRKSKSCYQWWKRTWKEKVALAFNTTSWTDSDCVCTINGKTFFALTKNTWIGDTVASYHITYNDDGLFDVKIINETMHGSSGRIKATKLGKKKTQINKWMKQQKIFSFNLLNFMPAQKLILYW